MSSRERLLERFRSKSRVESVESNESDISETLEESEEEDSRGGGKERGNNQMIGKKVEGPRTGVNLSTLL